MKTVTRLGGARNGLRFVPSTYRVGEALPDEAFLWLQTAWGKVSA